MGSDKLYYGTLGLVILMLGVSIILGVFFSMNVLGVVTLWVLSIGVILILVGVLSLLKLHRNSGRSQIGLGLLLVLISSGVFMVILQLFNIYVTLGIILIAGGMSIGALGLSKKE
jgi:uncharacterized membrane protein HdeD (DUF308 family)